jgi:4-oxalocrotonate tautomerase
MATLRLQNAWPGKSEPLKKNLAAEVTKAVTSTLSYGEETVSVGIEEVPARDRNEKVYKAHILGKRPTIYKQPGYDPNSFQAEDDRAQGVFATLDRVGSGARSQEAQPKRMCSQLTRYTRLAVPPKIMPFSCAEQPAKIRLNMFQTVPYPKPALSTGKFDEAMHRSAPKSSTQGSM